MTRLKLTTKELKRAENMYRLANRWRVSQDIGKIFYHSIISDEQLLLLQDYFRRADFVAEFLPTITEK